MENLKPFLVTIGAVVVGVWAYDMVIKPMISKPTAVAVTTAPSV